MNKKLLIEFVPLFIFYTFGICTLFKAGIPYSGLITAISGMMLAILYFYFAFKLFDPAGIAAIIRILAGLAFSINIIACLYIILSWPYVIVFAVISLVMMTGILITCLFNFKAPAYKPLLYRCIFFIIMLSFIYSYKRYAA